MHLCTVRKTHLTHTSRQSTQRGYILLPVVLALILLATIASLINREGAIQADMVANTTEAVTVEHVARAGLAHATWGAQNSGCAGDMAMTSVPFGPGDYTATVDSAATTTVYAPFFPDRDTWIDENNSVANHWNSTTLRVQNKAGGSWRGLTHFDLSSITAGSRVATATLWFYVTDNDPDGVINVHPVTAAWTETDATWDSIGDSYDSQVFGSITPQPAAGAWVSVNLTALAQSWVNDASANHGLMLIAASNDEVSDYTSKEYGTTSQRSYLQVTTAVGEISPLTITATGTLTGNPSPANDITRTLTRTNVPVYQPPGTQVLQPGTGGKDAFVYIWKDTWNYGAHRDLWVQDWNSDPDNIEYQSLLQFDLGNIPPGATVLNAVLSLHQNTTAADGGTVDVHRVTRNWNEGTKTSGTGPGVTWSESDTGTAWTTPGGDYDPAPIASTIIPVGTQDWFNWDITSLVNGWVNGDYENDGLALVPGAYGTKAYFDSSDATDPTLHPTLTLSYACECGSPCLAPQGSGKVLLVVSDTATPLPADVYKKALLESWGYTVKMIADNASQAAFNLDIGLHDVVYISETVDPALMAGKLGNAPIGIVSEEGLLNDDLGISNNAGITVGAAINVIDTSHYITALFPAGPLDIYSADMEQLVIFNGPAPDLQTLADVGGYSSLVTLDAGATLKGGATAAGRRVMLPLGRDTRFNWDHLNRNGQLIVQRALQWGTGNTGAPPKNLLFVSGGLVLIQFPSGDLQVIPTAQEQLRIDLIESWGYTVNLIADEDSQANFDAALAANDVAYVPTTIDATVLGTKLTAATIGVVIEKWTNDFGIATDFSVKSRDEIDIIDNTHYITSPYSTGLLTYLSSLQPVTKINNGLAPDLITLGTVFNTGTLWSDALAVINPGGSLAGGGTAAGRRVQLPWGDVGFDINALNAAGKDIMKRSIEWAEGAGSTPAPAYNVLLIVGNLTLSSNDVGYKALMESWGHTVTLIDDGDSQANYDTAMAAADVVYASGSALGANMLDKATNTTKGLVNEVVGKIDNFGFSSSTTSTVNTDAFSKTDAAHYITEPFSGNPVTVFTSSLTNPVPGGTLAPGMLNVGEVTGTLALGTLDTGAIRYDSAPSTGRRAHLPFASAEATDLTADGETILRRTIEWAAGAGGGGGGGGGGGPSPPACAASFGDDFETGDYTGSTGTAAWSGDWTEIIDAGNPNNGDVKIVSVSANQVLQIASSAEGAQRVADLSAYVTATLTLSYWRSGLDSVNEFGTVEVSADGSSWTILDQYVGPGSDTTSSPPTVLSYDISGHLSATTRIRFLTASSNGKFDAVLYDDIEICAND